MPTNYDGKPTREKLRDAVMTAMQNAVENGYGHSMMDQLDLVAIDIMDNDAAVAELLEDLEDAGTAASVNDVALMVRELQSELGWRPTPGDVRKFRGESRMEAGASGFEDACAAALGRDPDPNELEAFIASYVGKECTVVEIVNDDDVECVTWLVRFDDAVEAVVLPFDIASRA